MSRQKGYELLRDLAMREIVDVIRKKGAASASEICDATGRSRGNVDGYLRKLEEGKHVVQRIRKREPSLSYKGISFEYTARMGEVVELSAMREPTGPEHDEIVNAAATGGELHPSLDLTAPRGSTTLHTDYNAIETRVAAQLAEQGPGGFNLTRARVIMDMIDHKVLTFEVAVQSGLVPVTYTETEIREALALEAKIGEKLHDVLGRRGEPPQTIHELTVTGRFPSQPEQQVTQVIRASRSGPIPAHPSVYQQQIQGTSGPNPPEHPSDVLPESLRTGEGAALLRRFRKAGVEHQGTRRWQTGYTHLTKGGEFELCDLGGEKTGVRRVLGPDSYSIPVTLSTADALAMFIPASKADGTLDASAPDEDELGPRLAIVDVAPSPRLDPPYAEQEKRPRPAAPGPTRQPSGDVWITPKPPEAQPPLTSRSITSGADDLGHWGQGSKPDETTGDDAQGDEGGES